MPPSGPGVRVDTFGYEGYQTNPAFDPLLAKVIVHAPDYTLAVGRAKRALHEFVIGGIVTNIPFLHALLEEPRSFRTPYAHAPCRREYGALVRESTEWKPLEIVSAPTAAVAALPQNSTPDGTIAVAAPMQGKIVSIAVSVGDLVRKGTPVAVLEAMKMEHLVAVNISGRVHSIAAKPGDVLYEGTALIFLTPEDVADTASDAENTVDPDFIRPDLAESNARHDFGYDANRPDAVARRRKTNQRTARENVADLVDPGASSNTAHLPSPRRNAAAHLTI
ncbi:MAG: biotin/lipoyl-containing protein [Rhizomicrobium sp.]